MVTFPVFCTTDKHCFIDDKCIRGQTPVCNGHSFSQWQWLHSSMLWTLYTMFSDQVNISGCCQDHYQGNHYWTIHWLYKDVLSLYYAPCIVLCGGGGWMQGWIRHISCPLKDISALTGHHLPLLERPWWSWKDVLGLAWCDGDAVCMRVAGVVRFTHIGHTASHSGDKVVVMLLTLAVSLQQMGREQQNSYH